MTKVSTVGELRFNSTRSQTGLSFQSAVLAGLALDGGLFVPADVDASAYERSRHCTSIGDVAREWLSPLLPGIELDRLAGLYPFQAPLIRLQGGAFDDIHILELFHGPTLSFKDFGARFLQLALSESLERNASTAIVLVATSGDTGSAVASAMAESERVRVVLLYPDGMVSPTQERQLTSTRPGVTSLAVDGTFDDCQRLVKAAFDSEIAAETNLTSANSINIGRLLPQQTYYAWAANQLDSAPFVAVVPSGNLGNLAAGYLSMLGGTPVERFVAAHNRNDWFVRFLAGRNDPHPQTIATISNAMDVGSPSNFERLSYWATRDELSRNISGYTVSDDETMDTIRTVLAETGYLCDPHTAVGLRAATRYRASAKNELPIIVLGTAHPAKFPETIQQATGQPPTIPVQLDGLMDASTSRKLISPDLDAVLDAVLNQHSRF